MEEILNYTPQEQTPENKVASLAEAIKAKYPAPTEGGNVSQQPKDAFAAPIGGLKPKSRPTVSFTEYNVDADEIYTQLNDGTYEAKFDNYITGTDNNQRLANAQTTGEKWSHGVTKFAAKTGTAVLGSTIGSVSSIGELISTGSLNAMYSDDFNTWLDDLNTKLDHRLPNYYTAQEQEKGFFESLGTANFWANDFLGGLSFTIGSIVGEAIWATATGGASLATTGARTAARLGFKGFKTAADLAKANSAAARVSKQLLRSGQFSAKGARQVGRTLEGLNTARFVYTSAGYEAGVEARGFMKEAEENFKYTFEQNNGRQPSAEEWATFREDLVNSANTVFATNSVLVGASNLAIFGKMFDIPSPLSGATRATNKSLFGIGAKEATVEGRKVLSALKPTKMQKLAGKSYSILKAPVVEGVWEEGMQAVTSHGAQSWLSSMYDPEVTKENLSVLEAAYEGMSHTYGTKEGWKEIGLGMLIGFAGGGIATRGRFNEVSQAREANESLVGQVNTYSAENLFEIFKSSNQVTKAVKDIQAAEENNDLLGKELALRKLMYTNARVNHRFGKKDAAEDFRAAMEGLDDATFEAMGLDPNDSNYETQKKEKKQELHEQYKDIQREYKQDRATAEYLVGKDSIDGVENTEELIESVAYSIAMGRTSDKVANEAYNEIKNQITGDILENSGTMKFQGAISIDAILTRAHKNTRDRFYYHKDRAKKARFKKERAEKRLREAQMAPRKENQDVNTELQRLQEEVLTHTETAAQEAELMNQVFAMAKTENPYVTQDGAAVTEEDLLSSEQNLKEGMDYINRMKESNPTKYHTLRKLFSEFHRANYAFKQFNNTVQGFASESLDIQKETNFLTKLFKGKPTNEFTQEFFRQNLEAYRNLKGQLDQQLGGAQAEIQARKSRNIAEKLRQKQDLTEEEKSLYTANKEAIDRDVKALNVADIILDKGEDSLSEEEQGFYNSNKELVDNLVKEKTEGDNVKTETEEEQEEVNTLAQRIERAIKGDTAVMEYVGEDTDKVMSKKPTEAEVSRFEELTRKDRTEEEEAEYQNLSEKLSMWRVVDGSVDPDGYSLADLITAKEQEDATPASEGIKKELTEQETIEVGTVSEKESTATVENVNFLQTYENTKVKVSLNKKNFIFSHLNVESILNHFAGKVQIKTPKGKEKRNLTPELLNAYGKTEGTKFEINLGDSKVVITVEDKGRLVIPIEQFETIQETLGFKLVNPKLTKQSYFDVYIKVQPEGETAPTYVPRQSDFKLDTVSKGGIIVLEPQEIENIQSGEHLKFAVNMDSSFNTSLKEKYKNAKTAKAKKEVLKEIENSVEIYVQTEEGRIVGVVKALPKQVGSSDSEQNHLSIRKMAAKSFVKSLTSNEVVGLPATVPVTTVLVGTPNLILEETEEGLAPSNIEISDKALEQIDDFGFIEDGEISTKKGNVDGVNTTFIKNLGKNEKVPFIIFKHGKRRIAYPVSLISTVNNAALEVEQIVETETMTVSEKIVKINEVLLANGLSPKKYGLMEATSADITSRIDQAKEDLATREVAPDVENWLNSDKTILQEEAVISIDITDRPLKSPKVMVDFSSAEVAGSEATTESEQEGIEVEETLDFGMLTAKEELDLREPEDLGTGFPKITNEDIASMGAKKRAEKVVELRKERDEKLKALRSKEAETAMSQLKTKFGSQFGSLNNEVRRLDFVKEIKRFARERNDEITYNQANLISNVTTVPQIDRIVEGFDSIIRRVENTPTLQTEVSKIQKENC